MAPACCVGSLRNGAANVCGYRQGRNTGYSVMASSSLRLRFYSFRAKFYESYSGAFKKVNAARASRSGELLHNARCKSPVENRGGRRGLGVGYAPMHFDRLTQARPVARKVKAVEKSTRGNCGMVGCRGPRRLLVEHALGVRPHPVVTF